MKTLQPRLGIATALAVLAAGPLGAQQVQRLPLAPIPPRGEPVAPFFEGWYRNDDGTFTFSYGFFNLNTEEILDIPLGPENFIEPAEFDGDQPTHFPVRPRRDRGVFSVTVPESYADTSRRVVWTITSNGVTYSTPARVGIDALQLDYGPRAMGSVPPLVRFGDDGEVGQHVQGAHSRATHCGRGRAAPALAVGIGGIGALPGRQREHGCRGAGHLVQAPGTGR